MSSAGHEDGHGHRRREGELRKTTRFQKMSLRTEERPEAGTHDKVVGRTCDAGWIDNPFSHATGSSFGAERVDNLVRLLRHPQARRAHLRSQLTNQR